MSVLVVILAGLLFSAPILTHGVWQELYRHETAQIELDNQGVWLGRALRSLKKIQLFEETKMLRLEQEHHRLHQCGFGCQEADRVLELRLEMLSQDSEAKLQAAWDEVVSLLTERAEDFSEAFPFERASCQVCRGSWVWKWREGVLPLLAKLTGTSSSAPVFLCLPKLGEPQYWMFASVTSARRFCKP